MAKPPKHETLAPLLDAFLERVKQGEAELPLEDDGTISRSKLMQAIGRPKHDRQYLAPGNPNAPFLVPQIDAVARSLDLPPLGEAGNGGGALDEESATKRRVKELGGRLKERDDALLEALARAKAAEERAAFWEARYREVQETGVLQRLRPEVKEP